MSTESTRYWSRWLLAVWEGFLMLWFLIMCFFSVSLMLGHPEIFGVDAKKALAMPPEATALLKSIMDEPALLFLMLGISVGFGAVALVSEEAVTSRCFRWLVVVVATSFACALLPVYGLVTMLCGGTESGTLLGWVMLSALSLLVAWLGICYARRHMA
jgi:hypothetical protein